MTEAARTKAAIQTNTVLPDWPDYCRETVPHAPLAVGAEVRSVLKRERQALDTANEKLAACADLYDHIQADREG